MKCRRVQSIIENTTAGNTRSTRGVNDYPPSKHATNYVFLC